MYDQLEFTNKVVLVTGSSSGLGEAIAIEFVKLGATVVITGRNAERLKYVEQKCLDVVPSSLSTTTSTTAQQIRTKKLSSPILSIVADVTKEEDLDRLLQSTLDNFGQLDILVNNAGVALVSNVLDIKSALVVYDTVMALNSRSVFALSLKAIPHLMKTKGNIVNISSIAGTRVIPGFISYSMTKAGIDMFTKFLANDVGPHGIRVNSVNPGFFPTNVFSVMGMSSEQEAELFKKQAEVVPLRRVASPTDIAQSVIFLASSKAINITGSCNFNCSGGLWCEKLPI